MPLRPCHWQQPLESESESGSNLNLPHQSLWSGAQLIHWQSVSFDKLCSIKIVLTGGLHGASHSSLWASLRGKSESDSDGHWQHPDSELRLPPCRNYTRACSRSYKYMRMSTIKRRHDAIAKYLKLILWAGSWIKIVHTKRNARTWRVAWTLKEVLELWLPECR